MMRFGDLALRAANPGDALDTKLGAFAELLRFAAKEELVFFEP